MENTISTSTVETTSVPESPKPGLLIHFTPAGAKSFGQAIDRLEESIQPDPGFYPNLIRISTNGTTTTNLLFSHVPILEVSGQRFPVSSESIVKKIENSDSYLIDLTSVLSGGAGTMEEAQEQFSETDELDFSEIFGIDF